MDRSAHRTIRTLLASIWLGFCLSVTGVAAEPVRVAVISPTPADVLAGEVSFRFAVASGPPPIDRIEVHVAGRIIGTARPPDWSFRWEPPTGFAHWTLKAVAIGDGGVVEEFIFLTRRVAPAQRVEVGLVELEPVVLDPSGGFVGDLRRSDFRVLDNGAPVPIRSFTTRLGSLRLALVVDVSRSMTSRMELLRQAVRGFRRQLREDDRWTLYAFNHRLFEFGAEGHPPSLEAVEPYGGTATLDALAKVLPRLGRTDERRAIFLVSDGRDDTSLTRQEQVVRRARRSRVPIYTVGILGDPGAPIDRSRLRALARSTGGRAFFIRGPGGLAAALTAVERDLRTRYWLSYPVPAGPRGTRTVEVRVRRENHRVIHRESYVAD